MDQVRRTVTVLVFSFLYIFFTTGNQENTILSPNFYTSGKSLTSNSESVWPRTDGSGMEHVFIPAGSENHGIRLQSGVGNVYVFASFGSFVTRPIIAVWHLVIMLALIILFIRYREKRIRRRKQQLSQMIEARTRELEFQQEELKTQIEFTTIQNHKIENQNRELENHRKNLEDLVKQRTADLEKADRKSTRLNSSHYS